MFEKSLQSLVKGIRSHKDDEAAYVSKCLVEIKEELGSPEPNVKAQALQKLSYLHMMGYDMSWAAFHVVEVMSQPWYGHKLIGYSAASQCFNKDTDVILLTTHLFRKAFTQTAAMGPNSKRTELVGLQCETGSAISCLSTIVTRELAEDLLSDIYGMMNSSRPYIRKKAVLLLFNVFRQWPKALRMSFDRLKDKLTDDDPGVVSAAVYVLCELARHNPKNYLKLAPVFFKIMTTSANNWVLIKVVKLMGNLVPLEPRLAKKLASPLMEIIEVTPAKSLMYECVNTLLLGGITSKTVLQLCLSKLKMFVEDSDQNLKYLGLQGLQKLMRQHPRSVIEHKDLVLKCLDDDDITIRMRALDLITAMVTVRNVKSIIRRLEDHLYTVDGHYRQIVLERMIDICRDENYQYITDFEWYVQLLVTLTHIDGASVQNAAYITRQLLDVVIRVEGVREFAVHAMTTMLLEGRIWNERSAQMSEDGEQGSANPMTGVLQAAAWIVGEFSNNVTNHLGVIRILLSPAALNLLENIQAVFIQNALKVYARALARSHSPQWLAEVEQMTLIILDNLPKFTHSNFVEVQDRSVMFLHFVRWATAQMFPHLLKKRSTPESEPSSSSVASVLPVELPLGSVANGDDSGGGGGDNDESSKLSQVDDARITSIVQQLLSMFGDPLNPVAPEAQKRVGLPKGLDLDKWINPPDTTDDDDEDDDWVNVIGDGGRRMSHSGDGDGDDLFTNSSTGSRPEITLSPQEKEKQREARAAERARRAADPYYIPTDTKSSKSRLGVDDADAFDDNDVPPMQKADFELPPVQIEAVDVGHKSHKTRKRGFTDEDIVESRKQYVVTAVLDAPKGYEAENGNNGVDSDSDDLGKVNLDDPLGDDDHIRPIAAYGQSTSTPRSTVADTKKTKKHKKHKKDKKKKKKKKKKSKRDDGHDDDDDDDNDDDDEDKNVVRGASSTLDILALGVGDAPPPKSTADKKHKGKRVDAAASPPEADVMVSHKRFTPYAKKTMHNDERLSVCYFVHTDEEDSRHVKVQVVIQVTTPPFSANAVQLSNLKLDVTNNNHLRLKSGDLVIGKVKSGEVIERELVFQTAKLSGPQMLKCAVKYSYQYSLETKSVNASCSLLVPCSSFVHPQRMSVDEFGDLMTREVCPYIASTKVRLENSSVQHALKAVAKILNVKLVSAVHFTATYYGHSTQGDHVAVLVKTSKEEASSTNPSLSIDMKASKQFLCDSLLDELKLLLK